MGTPTGISQQQVETCCGDHIEEGLAQAAFSQLNIERRP